MPLARNRKLRSRHGRHFFGPLKMQTTGMISLGNHQRSPRSALPGSVSAGQVYAINKNRRSRNVNRTPASATPVAPVSSQNSIPEKATTDVKHATPFLPAPVRGPACGTACGPAPVEDLHWVWANAVTALSDAESGEKVCDAGTRVLLVYPMRADDETGSIRMRLRNVDPVTGQPMVCWVEVYDPITETRRLSSFSLSSQE